MIIILFIFVITGLVFFDPDNNTTYTIAKENLEYRKGRDGGWCVIAEPADDQFDVEPFMIGDMLVELIGNTPQEDHVKVIQNGKV